MFRSVRRKAGVVSLALVSLGALAACGDDKDDDKKEEGSSTTAVSYDDIKGFFATDCVTCHPTYNTKAALDAVKTSVLNRISIKTGEKDSEGKDPMPQGFNEAGKSYAETTNGAKLKQYLEGL